MMDKYNVKYVTKKNYVISGSRKVPFQYRTCSLKILLRGKMGFKIARNSCLGRGVFPLNMLKGKSRLG